MPIRVSLFLLSLLALGTALPLLHVDKMTTDAFLSWACALISLIVLAIYTVKNRRSKDSSKSNEIEDIDASGSSHNMQASDAGTTDVTNHSDRLLSYFPQATLAFESGALKYANPAAIKLLGIEPLHSPRFEDFFGSSDLEKLEKALNNNEKESLQRIESVRALTSDNKILSVCIDVFSKENNQYLILQQTGSIAANELSTHLREGSIERTDTVDASTNPQPITQSSRPTHSENQKRILVVDDSPTNLMMTKGLLAGCGYDVETASSGEESIARVKAKTYSLILMDLQMPGMDGYRATKEIRSLKNGTSCDIIALSGTKNEEVDARLQEAKLNTFILKPLDKEKLNTIIAALTSNVGSNVDAGQSEHDSGHEETDNNAFDMKMIEQMKKDIGVEKTRHMKKVAVNEIETRLAVLESKESHERSDLQREAHSIKSTAASFGLLTLTSLAQEIEHICASGDEQTIAPIVVQARSSFEQAKIRLDSFLN